jgi:hypothetical protein
VPGLANDLYYSFSRVAVRRKRNDIRRLALKSAPIGISAEHFVPGTQDFAAREALQPVTVFGKRR